MEESQRYKLEEFVAELEKYRGRHTELVTVYVPAGYSLIAVAKLLEQEKSTASNIKSKGTRKNVLDALERLTRHLKLIQKNPENGLALFAGNISDNEGQPDIKVWSFEPPVPMRARLYRCDQEFVLEPLKEILEVGEVYGLVVIEVNEATIGILEGKQIRVLQKMTSGVPGKTEKGGQCLSPESLVETKKGVKRLADIHAGDYIKALDIESKKIIFTKCINVWNNNKSNNRELSIENDNWKIMASKDHTFFKKDGEEIIEVSAGDLEPMDLLITNKKGKINFVEIFDLIDIQEEKDLVDIETEAGNFFSNGILVHNSAARYGRIREGMKKEFYRRVAEAVKNNFWDMKKLKGILVGGPGPTKEDFLKEGQIVTALREKIIGVRDIGYADEHGLDLLVETSRDLLSEQEIIKEKVILEDFMTKLAKAPEKTVYGLEDVKKALDAGAVELLIMSKKLDRKYITEYTARAENISSRIVLVSEDTEEGRQFASLGRIGAILRFDIGLR